MNKVNVGKLFKVTVILLTAAMTSCGDSDSSRVAKDYLKETMSFNFEEAKKYAAKDKIVLYDEAKKNYAAYDTDLITGLIKSSETKFTVVSENVSDNGNTAKVTVRISLIHSTFKDREILLIKENGEWKVVNDNIDNLLPPKTVFFEKGKGVYIDETREEDKADEESIADSLEGENEDEYSEEVKEIYSQAEIETPPSFPGGETELMEWVQDNIKYPAIALESRIYGNVFVGFVVEKDGSLTNVEVVRGVDRSLDAEAIRVVSAMPGWIPGEHRGEAVRVRCVVPIQFRLQQ